MPRTLRSVFDAIISFENLWAGYLLARRGKRGHREELAFEMDLEDQLWSLHDDLTSGAYRPGPYRQFEVTDAKRRRIAAPAFRDRVLHQAICIHWGPFLDRKLVQETYACRPGKGQHLCLVAAQEQLRTHEWCLKLDIARYFASIDHALLKRLVRKVVGDPRLVTVLDLFVESGREVYDAMEPPANFPGDTWVCEAWRRGHGLVLGALLSQHMANLYLAPLDRFVTRKLALPYLRYMDDFLVFSNRRSELLAARDRVVSFLAGWRLRVHEKKVKLYPAAEGVPFLGFRQYPWGRKLLRSAIKRQNRRLRWRRRQFERGEVALATVLASARSWMAHCAWSTNGEAIARRLWRKVGPL